MFLGVLAQQKKPALGLREFPAQRSGQATVEQIAAFAVDRHLVLDVGMVVMLEGDFAGDLDGVELAGIDVAFDLCQCANDRGIADQAHPSRQPVMLKLLEKGNGTRWRHPSRHAPAECSWELLQNKLRRTPGRWRSPSRMLTAMATAFS